MKRLLIIAGVVAALADPVWAAQGAYPSRPIRIIVPSSPGGGLDFTARTVGQQLTAAWGQSVVIDNRAGAGGTIGPDLVAKALATTGAKRSPAMPDVPTMAEQGLPGATINGWFAFLAPARTPRAIIDRLNAELTRILQTPGMREQLAREGSEPAPGTSEQLGKHIASEIQRLGKIAKASGAVAQ